MYKIFFAVLTLIILAATLFMAIFAPKMHKNLFVYDSSLKIVMQETASVDTKVMPVKINTVKQEPAKQKAIQLSPQKTQITSKSTLTQVKPVQNVQTVSKPVNVQPAAQTKPKSAVKTTVQKNTAKPALQPAAKKTAQPAQKKQTVQPKPAKTQAQIEQEELILWNKWRSDLQNRIMNDVKLPIVKQGTVFRFSFDVDKYGKVSNVTTWSDDAAYTPYAIQYVAPVIRRYQGRSFLNFPAGSSRVTTTVSGAWRIADKTTYSTPEDYKDVERIRN